MFDVEQFRGVVNRAVAVVVVADRAIELVIAENAVEGLGPGRLRPRSRAVDTFMPAITVVAQARTSWPLTSTMQVSHVWIGPELRVIADLRQVQLAD